jgi:hypothetical protein
MIYYEKDGIRVRTSVKKDAEYLHDKLRKSDVEEVWKSHHHTPKEALERSTNNSIFCLTIENCVPIGMFGICPEQLLGDKASIWMLGSDDINKITYKIVRECRNFIKKMLEYYPYLHNFVDAENKKSIQWLKWMGATMSEPKPYGAEQKMFIYFYFRR